MFVEEVKKLCPISVFDSPNVTSKANEEESLKVSPSPLAKYFLFTVVSYNRIVYKRVYKV